MPCEPIRAAARGAIFQPLPVGRLALHLKASRSVGESPNREIDTHEGSRLTPLRTRIYNHKADSVSEHTFLTRLRNLTVCGEVPR
jgi:hypothetical protein